MLSRCWSWKLQGQTFSTRNWGRLKLNELSPLVANGFVDLHTLEIQNFYFFLCLLWPGSQTVNCFLKFTKTSEMETKDLMGDSFKSRCARELGISLLRPASSVPETWSLSLTASAVFCSDCSKRLSWPSLWPNSFGFPGRCCRLPCTSEHTFPLSSGPSPLWSPLGKLVPHSLTNCFLSFKHCLH